MDQIACLTIREKQRRHYSFATKYCSWHQPEQFPIFDNQVASLLLLYKRQWAFSEFNHDSLRNYDAYKAVIRSFQGGRRRHEDISPIPIQALLLFHPY